MAGDEHLCKMLSDIRTSRQLSIRRMAQISGVSRESIRKYEKGLLIPSNNALDKIIKNLNIERTESRQIQLYVYQARRQRSGGDTRSFGIAAQAELESMFSDQESMEANAEKLVELFFSEVSPERRTESFEFYLKGKVLKILRG